MTIYSDTLHWWDITPIFYPLLIWTLLLNLTFYLIVWDFHRTFATGAACQQRTLTPPDTWSCPTLGLAWVLMSRPISPELVLFPDFWVSNIPRYFCFVWNPDMAMHFTIAPSYHRLVGRWCDGAMTMTRWRDDDDAMVRWRDSAMVRWRDGAIARWSDGAMTRWR